MSDSLGLADLRAAIGGSAAAFRSITILQPVEGEGGKVFPATYADGKYAVEKRRLQPDADPVDCVLIDSCQSQSNHAELGLLSGVERGRISLPLIEVDFSEANASLRKPLGNLTSLEVPHRLADAILRDSQLDDGTRFSKSSYAVRWSRANLWNATPIYELNPTALLFGMWGSPEKPGGLGAKFERAYISEIVAVDVLRVGQRFGFRVDPVSASAKVPVLPKIDGGFDVVQGEKPPKGARRPSELNHGNIVFENDNGGIRCRFLEQTTVVSLGALRKLRFPEDGQTRSTPERDDAGRAVLAATGICAGVLAAERGISLRSRCNLVPTAPRLWEVVDTPGRPSMNFSLTGDEATALLNAAVEHAKSVGLVWMQEKLRLTPTKELVDLIRLSQEKMAVEGEDEDA